MKLSKSINKNTLKAAVEYIARRDRTSHPEGHFDNAKRWYPSSQEECECCWGLRSPSRAYPHSLNVHCRTARHVANLFEVDESALKKAAKYLDSDAGQLLMLRQRAGLRQQDLADAAGVGIPVDRDQ